MTTNMEWTVGVAGSLGEKRQRRQIQVLRGDTSLEPIEYNNIHSVDLLFRANGERTLYPGHFMPSSCIYMALNLV